MTLESNDHLVHQVEQGIRAPLPGGGRFVITIPRDTPLHELDTVLEMIDGVLLSGGADVAPRAGTARTRTR